MLIGGERDLKACSLYPARSVPMVVELFRGEGWGEGRYRAFKHGLDIRNDYIANSRNIPHTLNLARKPRTP